MSINLESINERICDRTDCFYWQTDRKLTAEEAATIWKDRHTPIKNDEVISIINNELKGDRIKSIESWDADPQTSQGNINSIRIGELESGKKVIIRCHPKGVKNGYFHVESLASKITLDHGLPAYKTYLIHDLKDTDDIALQVIEKLPGDTPVFYLREHPEREEQIVYEMGKTLAELHKIKVNGFGPFSNEEAKKGKLIGNFKTLNDSVNAGLDENLKRLVTIGIITPKVADKIKGLFTDNPLLDSKESTLIQNDFADWNMLTDGKTITGILDWDECVGGHPILDIACWSTFFDPKRLDSFLKGYYSNTEKPDDFEELFQLFRLRYTISKMALRLKRFQYEKSDFLKNLIEKGQLHLKELLDIFNLEETNKE